MSNTVQMGTREARIQRFFDAATTGAALATLPVIVGLALDLPSGLDDALWTVNWLLWGVFAAELVVMLTVSRDRKGWLREHSATPAIVAITSPALVGLEAFRLVRLLRGKSTGRVIRSLTSQSGLRNLAMFTLLLVGLCGFVFARIEPDVGPWEGLYWAVTTATTVGYGDVVPTTDEGRALAVFLMIVGAAFLAVLTGAAAERYVSQWRDRHGGGDLGEGSTPARDDAVLAKLDELGLRLTALEQAVRQNRG